MCAKSIKLMSEVRSAQHTLDVRFYIAHARNSQSKPVTSIQQKQLLKLDGVLRVFLAMLKPESGRDVDTNEMPCGNRHYLLIADIVVPGTSVQPRVMLWPLYIRSENQLSSRTSFSTSRFAKAFRSASGSSTPASRIATTRCIRPAI